MGKSISIIIPAYNEEENISETAKVCSEFISGITDDFEIIIINDGSKDRTGQILESLKGSLKNLKVFHHLKNEGMGSSVKTGILSAQKKLIFTTSADLQYNISEIKKFLPLIGDTDIVIGFRLNRNSSFFRSFCTFIYKIFLSFLFGLNFKDPTSIKLFKKNVFGKISIQSSGFFWEAEVLIKAKKAGFIIKEVGVHSQKRKAGKSSGGNLVKIFETFCQMLKFWWKYNF